MLKTSGAVEAALHALEQPAPILQMSALDTLAVIGKGNRLVINDIATLVCSVCSPNRDSCLKCHALKRLAEIAPKGEERALDALLVGLADMDERVRQQAKEVTPGLVRPGDSMFIARFVEKLRHSDRQVRHAVVETLPLVAGEEGLDRAILECGMLLENNNWVVRQFALKAVASLAQGGGRDSATVMAISCLQDRDRDIRCEALEIIPKIAPKGDENAILSMMACLTDGERDVREAVLHTLPSLVEGGSQGALKAIETYLVHPDADVRHSAILLLPVLALPGDSGSIWGLILPLLDDKLARIRCSAIDALVALGEPIDMHSSLADDTYEALSACLMDPEKAVRWAAMKALTALLDAVCNEEAQKILMERLDDGCFDERWRDALGQLMHAFKEKCVKSPADFAARGSLWSSASSKSGEKPDITITPASLHVEELEEAPPCCNSATDSLTFSAVTGTAFSGQSDDKETDFALTEQSHVETWPTSKATEHTTYPVGKQLEAVSEVTTFPNSKAQGTKGAEATEVTSFPSIQASTPVREFTAFPEVAPARMKPQGDHRPTLTTSSGSDSWGDAEAIVDTQDGFEGFGMANSKTLQS
eukprot:symbB.v1.2.009010.t1/scaffold564.1/size186654/4